MADWKAKFSDVVASDGNAAVRRLRDREARLRGDRLAQERQQAAETRDRKPVPPQHWIENDYFCGSLARSMYPGLKHHFVDIVERKVPLVILRGSTRWGKCVHGDTEIFDLSSGRRRFAKEVGRFEVPTMIERDGKIVSAQAESFPSGVKRCVELRLASGSKVVLSVDHPVFSRAGWVDAGEMAVGDLVATPRRIPKPRKYFSVSDDIVKIAAYLLADGGCTTRTPTFTSANSGILVEFSGVVQRVGKPWLDMRGNGKCNVRMCKHSNSGRATTLSARGIWWLLDEYDLRGKSVDKRVPAQFYSLSPRQAGLFINRFWACDGSVYVGKPEKIELTLASEKMIDDIRFLLLRLGVLTRKYDKVASYVDVAGVRRKFKAWGLMVYGRGNILRFFATVGYIFGKEVACKRLERLCKRRTPDRSNVDVVPINKDMVADIKDEYEKDGRYRGAWKRGRWGSLRRRLVIGRTRFNRFCSDIGYEGEHRWLGESDLFWDRVIEVSDVGEHEVYDLSVPSTGSFVGNGIVLHNTYLTRALKGRSIYEVSCMGSPQTVFGLDEMSVLLYLNMNVNEKKAKDAFFTSFSSWVRSTKYFVREFPPASNVTNELRFPKHILSKYSGPLVNAAESEDLFFFVGDEANNYDIVEGSRRAREGTRYDAAEEISAAVINRMQGTYMDKVTGKYPSPCKVVWLCKERYPDSFIPRIAEEAEREGLVDAGLAMVISSTEWGFKPLPKTVRYFYIQTGTRMESARILDTREEADGAKARAAKLVEDEVPADEQFQVCDVPIVYRRAAEKNLEMFVRDMCGIPSRAISAFFREREVIFRALRRPGDQVCRVVVPQESCVHPFTAESTNTADGVELIKERLCRRVKTGNVAHNQRTGREEEETIWRPRVSPGVPRFFGCDAGLTSDSFGVAMGHKCGWKKVVRMEGVEPVEIYAPVIWIDLVLRITPPPDGQIPFSYALGLIYQLARIGFGFSKVTCDSYQHVALTQPLKDYGYDTEIVSVVKTPDAYNLLHRAYREGRVSVYEYELLEEELGGLERIITNRTLHGSPMEQVDHKPSGSKDVADAVAQVITAVEMESESFVGEDMRRVESLEFRERKQLVEEHSREHAKVSAFEAGDFVRLKSMFDAESDDDL